MGRPMIPLLKNLKTRNERGCRQQVSHGSSLSPSCISERKSKAIEAMVAAGKSPKPTSSSSWAYTVNCFLGSLAIDELGAWAQARATWAAVICPTSRLSLLNLPWEVTHAHRPVQLVRVEMTIGQCWELPNEDAEPQDGKSTIPESSYGGNTSHEEQSHVTWAVTWVRNQFVKSLRFLGSSNIAVSVTLKKQNKTQTLVGAFWRSR